jgi:hypothetical protein
MFAATLLHAASGAPGVCRGLSHAHPHPDAQDPHTLPQQGQQQAQQHGQQQPPRRQQQQPPQQQDLQLQALTNLGLNLRGSTPRATTVRRHPSGKL